MKIGCTNDRQLFGDILLQGFVWQWRSYFILLLIIWVILQCVFTMRGLRQYRQKPDNAKGRTIDQAKSPVRQDKVESKSVHKEIDQNSHSSSRVILSFRVFFFF